MARKQLPPSLARFLAALAAVAVFLALAGINPLDWLGRDASTGLLPPKESAPAIPAREDAALLEKWKAEEAPAILAALAPAELPPAAAFPAEFPPPPEAEPYLPRLAAAEGGAALPPAEDAVVLDGHLVLAASGRPLAAIPPAPGEPELPLSGLPGGARLLAADFDNDGDTDLYLGRGAGLPGSLYRQGADGTFADVTAAAGLLDFLDFVDGAWVDFDRDGLLDLFTVSRPTGGESDAGPSVLRLYRNLDGKRFAEISRETALAAPGKVGGFLWRDVDGDGFPDLLLSLAGDPGGLLLLAALPAPKATDWRWADATAAFGLGEIPGGGPLAAADFDQSGSEEIAVAAGGDRLALLAREGGNALAPFADVSGALELEGVADPGALAFADLDADGFPDLVLAGLDENGAPAAKAWWNVRGHRFREIPGAAGLFNEAAAPRRLSWVDPRGDGSAGFVFAAGPDAGAALLLPLPETIAENRRVVLSLEAGPGASREGRGARVTVVTRDVNWTLATVTRVLDSLPAVLGLGLASSIESLAVTWPDREGSVTRHEKLPVNHRLVLGPAPGEVRAEPLPEPEAEPVAEPDPEPETAADPESPPAAADPDASPPASEQS